MVNFIVKYKLLFLLLSLFIAMLLFGNLVPITAKSFFYAVSLSIKNIIVFLLPLVIFTFLWGSLVALQKRAGKFILLLLILVSFSNFIAILAGYEIGIYLLPIIKFNLAMVDSNLQLHPAWNLVLPQIISTKNAIIISIILGLFFAFKPNPYISRIAQIMNDSVIYFLRHYFTPILPLFILGFLFKLEHEKVLSQLIAAYGMIFLLVVCAQALYTVVLYFLAAGFKFRKLWEYMRNMMPASITAFSTVSSAATMPITLVCTEKNLKDNKMFARTIIPATCNIHTIGSSIGVTILALATLKAFGLPLPDLKNFLTFAIYCTLAKYAVAGVPGGVVIVVAPLLEIYLGFTSEMVGIVTALYLLFDPCGTATNVTCNGAFALIFDKIYHAELIKKFFINPFKSR